MSLSIKKNGIFDPEGKYPNPLTEQPYSKSYKSLALGKKGWSALKAWDSKIDIIRFCLIKKKKELIIIQIKAIKEYIKCKIILKGSKRIFHNSIKIGS